MKLKGLITVTLVMAGLSACAVSDTAVSGLRPLEEKNALLIFTAGPFNKPAIQRTMFADPSQREEYALFKQSNQIAEVVFLSTRHLHTNNLGLDNWGTLDAMISGWNYTKSGVQLDQEAYRFDAGWVGYWVKPFVVSQTEQNCAGFRAEWDGRADDPEHRPSKMIFGYFCENPGLSLSRVDIEKRIQELGVRGISVRLRGNIIEVAAVPDAPTQTELKTRVQQGPHGTPKFPYIRARSFSVGECSGQVPCP